MGKYRRFRVACFSRCLDSTGGKRVNKRAWFDVAGDIVVLCLPALACQLDTPGRKRFITNLAWFTVAGETVFIRFAWLFREADATGRIFYALPRFKYWVKSSCYG